MKKFLLSLLLFASVAAHSASNTLHDNNGNVISAGYLSTTAIAGVTMTSGVLGTSVYYLTQSAKATVEIDNRINTVTVYASFSNLSYAVAVGSPSTDGGMGMEAVITATAQTWLVENGTWPIGYNWLHIINISSKKPTLKNTY